MLNNPNDPNSPDFNIGFDQYAELAAETATYPTNFPIQAILYTAIGLSAETGEVANEVKKFMRDDDYLMTDDRRAKLKAELGDVLWYWFELCRMLKLDPVSVATDNLIKLKNRKANGTIKGAGNDR